MKAFVLAHPYEVFSALTLLGALYHWLQKAAKGEASFSPVEYWIKDTPGYTAGTLGALLMSWWAVVSGEMLDGAKWQLVIGTAIATGYTLNSAISKGACAPIAAAGASTPGREAGFIKGEYVILLIALVALVVLTLPGCATPPAQTKNQAQALSYYTIGQGYQAIDAAFTRGDIGNDTSRTLALQVDLSRGFLDLARHPSSAAVQDALDLTALALGRLHINGRPALTAAQLNQVNAALTLARSVTQGGPLPRPDDTAAWLMLGSEMLRAVGAATAR